MTDRSENGKTISTGYTVAGHNWTDGFGRYGRGVVDGFTDGEKGRKAIVRWANGDRTEVSSHNLNKLAG